MAIFSTRIYTTYSVHNDNIEKNLVSNDIYFEEVYSFYHFNIENDDAELNSIKTNDYINFNYSGGSLGLYATDVYHYDLIEAAKTDFYIEVNIEYDYSGSTLAEFFIRLESDFSEDGSLATGEWEHRITQNIIYDVSDIENLNCLIIGHPFDSFEEYDTTEGTIYNPGFFTIRIGRQNGEVLCETDGTPDYYLNHLWSTGLTKPLNSIYIGGIIYPINDSIVDVSFNGFYAKFKYGEELTTPGTTTSNGNETIPYWIWIIVGGGFVLAIGFPIVINVIMKEKTA